MEESGLYSPSSQLSEWSTVEAGEDEGVEAAAGGAAAGGEATATAGEPMLVDEAGSGSRQDGGQAGAAGLAPSPTAASRVHLFSPETRPQALRRESPYTRTSLSVWLASKQTGGQPARVLQPGLCFHEREIVQQVGG